MTMFGYIFVIRNNKTKNNMNLRAKDKLQQNLSKTKTSSLHFNYSAMTFIMFLTLKLTDNIDWSWWWVTSPLWIPVVIGFAIGAIKGIN